MTRTGAAARPDLEERTESVLQWMELHTRQLAVGVLVVLLVAAGVWFYRASERTRAESAGRSLAEAQEAFNAQNPALAQSDLEKVVKRYGGTQPGKQAKLLLAQVLFQRGQYQKGIDEVKSLVSERDKHLVATAYGLMAAGYEEMGKFAQAADRYRKAADNAADTGSRFTYLAGAARALTSAGDSTGARKIWSTLASDASNPSAAEARVRLGELEAKAARS
jgi:predicted negative regulator of RcsB-dependent stress response